MTIPNSEAVTELVNRAYKLGFEIGFYGHYESLGWIAREKEKIIVLARSFGVVSAVSNAYKKGKRRGVEMKRSKITKSSDSRFESEQEEVADFGDIGERTPSPAHIKPKILTIPILIRRGRVFEMPGLLQGDMLD